jgi:hypothetical protein
VLLTPLSLLIDTKAKVTSHQLYQQLFVLQQWLPKTARRISLGKGMGMGPQEKILFSLAYSAEIIFSTSFNQLFHKDPSEL